ncbi:MAG: TonB-dependent receptor, partial [Oleiharenicola lentus]
DEYLVVNADRARVLGFELESGWKAGHDVTVTLAASLSRATLTDFTDPFTGSNYSGKQAPFAPAGNGSLRVDYRPATGFFAGAGVTWTGTTYYDEQETAMFAQRSYTLIEADAGYAFARGELHLFGRNLGNEEYYSSITPGVGHATPGAPLTWGGELSLHW